MSGPGLSPGPIANSIPPEILEYFFIYCVPDHSFTSASKTVPPFSLCQVNQLWRSVAISTPSIWRSLSIDVRKMMEIGDALPKDWIQRSQNLPLDIKLVWYPVINVDNSRLHEELVDYFISTSSRWRKLHFSLADGSDSHFLWFHLRKLFSSPMPTLEALEIDCAPPPTGAIRLPETRVPNLRRFQDFRAQSNPLKYSLPWTQLTHLKYLHCRGIPHTLRLLEKCPNLEVLDLCLESYRTTRVVDPPARFDCLWSLTVRNTGGENLDPFFGSLELPALCELNIMTDQLLEHGDVPWAAEGIKGLVKRSGSNRKLKNLRVKGYDCGSEVMEDIYSGIEGLETFDISP